MRKGREINRREFLGRSAIVAGVGPFVRRAATTTRPNLLLVFPDQHRFDWTSLNSDIPVRTPHLERLAREGVRFTDTLCPSPLCAPSRASLAMGRLYDHTGVWDNGDRLPDGARTFYTLLRDSGYNVGSTGKLDLRKPDKDWGIDGLHRTDGRSYFREWGFSHGLDSEGKGDSLSGIKIDPDTKQRTGVSPYIHLLMRRDDGSLDACAPPRRVGEHAQFRTRQPIVRLPDPPKSR